MTLTQIQPLRCAILLAVVALTAIASIGAEEPDSKEQPTAAPSDGTKQATEPAKPKTAPAATTTTKPKPPPHALLLKDAKVVDGLFKLYRKETKLYAELGSSHYNTNFIVLISIARGVGQGVLMPGMTWKNDEDWVWQFRKVDNRVLIVRRNLRFRANTGSPQAGAVQNAYTDSILFSLPIVTKGPGGGDLVDLSLVFLSDLPQISKAMPGFQFSKPRSLWSAVKAFKDNAELQVAATYSSSGSRNLVAVPDSRAVTINVHYSISKLSKTGYVPRLADDRVGYFVTATMDYSKKTHHDRFVRFINRWHITKADPAAEKSPPKKPLIFWIENTVPFKYRKPIRDGVLEWNKAFEKAGIVDAIEVRQQPDSAEWDPEDINYNTIRWITAGEGIAYGPSRVNPTTGEILDSDILIDADYVHFSQELYETYHGDAQPGDLASRKDLVPLRDLERHGFDCRCQLHGGLARELQLGATVLARKSGPAEIEKLIVQQLRSTIMHEVGHALGLRHNFKASTNLSIQQLNDAKYVAEHGSVASVMDYIPANMVLDGGSQGDYYPQTIGAYDYWAVEYGYKPLPGGSPGGELPHLKKIAGRSGESGLSYASDEDTRSIDPDPLSERFDLGRDPIEFARHRAKLVAQQMPGLVDRVTKEGENYYQARRSFGILLSTHGRAMDSAARMIGGIEVHRHHKGDKDARPPFVVVAADRQREALKLLEKEVFKDKPFRFPPKLYNHLASPRWIHWGTSLTDRADYPVHRVIRMWQQYILSRLLSSITLTRLYDSELKVPSDKDAFTTTELIQRLRKAIFSEIEQLEPGAYTNRQPAISSLRRNLQRMLLQHLANLAMGNSSAPDDCHTIAYAELMTLENNIQKVLKKKQIKLDDYSRAHLSETAARIDKVLHASLELRGP
ncbi:MAG: zinc-dependent metalloprotease [Pirellulales bacterium]